MEVCLEASGHLPHSNSPPPSPILSMNEETESIDRPVWHEDGDIVLNGAENKLQHHFSVHRFILCRASPVFRGMLAIPQPANVGKSNGCPVIPLHDSVSDVRALLSALYDGLAMHLTLDSALGILRLSHKYCIEGLQSGITRKLQEDWPLNKSDYLTRKKQLGSPGSRIPESMKLINAAQRSEAWNLLPTAFYELAAVGMHRWSDVESSASRECFSFENMSRLLTGRARSQRFRRLVTWQGFDYPLWYRDLDAAPDTIFAGFHKDGPRTCRNTRDNVHGYHNGERYCSSVFTILKSAIGEQFVDGEFGLSALRKLERTTLANKGPCSGCIDWFMSVLANKQQENWESIPVDFDLPRIDSKLYSESIFKSLM